VKFPWPRLCADDSAASTADVKRKRTSVDWTLRRRDFMIILSGFW
jgi:hypothetical protein